MLENGQQQQQYQIEEDQQQWQKFRKTLEKRNKEVEKVEKGKVDIQLGESFGINHDNIKDNLSVIGNSTIVFYTGNVLVLKDMVTKTSEFIQKNKRLQNVTAIAIKEAQGERVVAAGESSVDEEQVVTISVILQEKNKWFLLSNPQLKGQFKHLDIN